jgi:hypothetical protein
VYQLTVMIQYLMTASDMTKGSKLKPDAPEFVPLASKGDVTRPTTAADSKAAAKAQKKLEKEQRKAASSLSKKSGKSLGRNHDGADGMWRGLDGNLDRTDKTQI